MDICAGCLTNCVFIVFLAAVKRSACMTWFEYNTCTYIRFYVEHSRWDLVVLVRASLRRPSCKQKGCVVGVVTKAQIPSSKMMWLSGYEGFGGSWKRDSLSRNSSSGDVALDIHLLLEGEDRL